MEAHVYFPVVHALRHELQALEEQAVEIRSSGKIVPVLIPTKRRADSGFSRVATTLRRFQRSGQPFCLVVNPSQGILAKDPRSISDQLVGGVLLECRTYHPTYTIGPNTRLQHVQAFLDAFAAHRVCLFHEHAMENPEMLVRTINQAGNVLYNLLSESGTGRRYRRFFGGFGPVLIEDPFVKLERNADYPEEEYYSDTYSEYREEGFIGFGDYQTVGRKLTKGHAPHAVALHLTYPAQDGEIRVRHFVSDRVETTDDPGGKFLEAARKLVTWANANPQLVSFSSAIPEYRRFVQAQTFPGLGVPKKLSVRHHLELMKMLLSDS